MSISKDTRLANLEAFCLTVEHGSFTAAAKILGVSPQATSRAVGRLEKGVGVSLFRRNTRHVEPTEAGRAYYAACRQALDALRSGEQAISELTEEPAGLVRVSVPTTYGHHRFMGMLPGFRHAFPRVEVDVEIANHNVEFVRSGFDLAIRMGDLGDASFVARRLGDFTVGVFASPDYIAMHGAPQTPDGIAGQAHACAVFVMPSSGRVLPWTFSPAPRVLEPAAAVRIRHDVLGLISFARAGGGLVQIYHFLVELELERGTLVEVLEDYAGRSRPFSLVYPREAVERPAVRALVDFVVEASERDRVS